MSNIQQARIDAVLDKKFNYGGEGILTRREWLAKRLLSGSRIVSAEVTDHAAVNRNEKELQYLLRRGEPSGNPNWPDTKRFNALTVEMETTPTKIEYRLVHPDRSFHILTKIEFDYAKGA